MYFIPFNCYKDKYSNCIYFFIDYDMEIFNICFNYGYNSDNNTGYAHLLEHIMIKVNQEEWSYLQNGGVQFNAVTEEYNTIYTFLNLRNSFFLYQNKGKIIDTFRNIQIRHINQGLFDAEKATITEELSILEKQLSTLAAVNMLGNREEINCFTIEKMQDIYRKQYYAMSSVYIGKLDTQKGYIPIRKKLVLNIDKVIVKKKSNLEFCMKKNIETNIILFLLHICHVSQIVRKWDMEIQSDSFEIRIKFTQQIKIIQKSHVLNRYCLLCTNLKMYMEEIKYIMMNDLLELNIEKAFLEDWEGFFL